MKKIIAILFVLIMVLGCLTSCAGKNEKVTEEASSERQIQETSHEVQNEEAEKQLVIYEINTVSDGGPYECNHVNVLEKWNDEDALDARSEDAPKEKTIEFNGKTYTGKYEESRYYEFNTYRTDLYECETHDYGDVIWFEIDSSTGLCTDIVFNWPSETISDTNTTAEDYKDKAIKLASEYIDVDDYKLTSETDEDGYTYYFNRYIGEYRTCESLVVRLTKNGEFDLFLNRMTDQFDKIFSEKSTAELEKSVERFASDEAKKAVDERIWTMYPKMDSYITTDQQLILLDDGTIGMAYTIETTTSTPGENGLTYISSTLETLIVTEE